MSAVILTLLAVLAGLAFVLFVGGILSAAYDVRQERKAGLPVTRPGWERERYTRGLDYARGLWKGLRS